MQFKPKTEREIAEMNLLPKGEYSFEICQSDETVSKASGMPMLVITLKLYDQNLHACGRVTDYLLESMAHKLRHAAYGCGIGDKYETGTIQASDFRGLTGMVKIGIQQDKAGKYPDKNVVVDYVLPKEGAVQPAAKPFGSFNAFEDQDIPF